MTLLIFPAFFSIHAGFCSTTWSTGKCAPLGAAWSAVYALCSLTVTPPLLCCVLNKNNARPTRPKQSRRWKESKPPRMTERGKRPRKSPRTPLRCAPHRTNHCRRSPQTPTKHRRPHPPSCRRSWLRGGTRLASRLELYFSLSLGSWLGVGLQPVQATITCQTRLS